MFRSGKSSSAAGLTLAILCIALAGISAENVPSSGIDAASMDKSIVPGDDFYNYANGGWVRSQPIPSDRASVSLFTQIADKTRNDIQSIILGATNSKPPVDSIAAKIGDFYSTWMDEQTIESKGLSPLKAQFEEISAISDAHVLSRALGSRMRADVDAMNATNFYTPNLFGVWVVQGLTDPAHYYPYLLQGGLGLPDRDYYVSGAPRMAALRAQYQEHIASMFRLAGFDDPSARAARVFALETKMANVHATRPESGNVHAPETWKTADLDSRAPGIDWRAFLDAAGLKAAPSLVAWQPKPIAGLSALVASEPLESWKDWLVFHALESSAAILPKAFADEQFHFSGTVLSGIQQQRPRTLLAIDATNRALGEAMGELYVQKYFSPETKAQIRAMVRNLEQAFGRRLDALSWMSPQTKANAKRKLATLRVGIGYPDRWNDFSGLRIVRGDALGNAERVSLFRYQTQIAKLGKKVDSDEWWTTPQTVNAYNLPLQNGLNFPAAMLQPPYFVPGGDAARNYGSEGSVIGHEISHSFDDQGSQFDAQGRLANWFTNADLEHLQAACASLATQFDQYRPFPDVAVNGRQTLSENVADLAGLLAAYDAYRQSLQGKPDIVKDGLTGDQRFFLGFAQVWRGNTREAALRKSLATNGHAPGMFRVDEVRNVDAWYAAFHVLPDQKLYLAPADRIRIW